MKPIADAWCIQIELNNVCPKSCAYCTRFNRHLRDDQRYQMSVDRVEYILELFERRGYEGKIGIIGGEPTVHPEFERICQVLGAGNEWVGLWTSGGEAYAKWKRLINRTFDFVAFNDKRDPRCHHHPMTMASCDVVPNRKLRDELIDNCWVQRIWCPSVTPKGVFFCECAAAWDRLLDGPGGWALESDWMDYGPEMYRSQMWACELCGMCVPMEQAKVGVKERVSPTVLIEMTKARCRMIGAEDVSLESDFVDRVIYDRRVSEGWAPGEYVPGRAKGGA